MQIQHTLLYKSNPNGVYVDTVWAGSVSRAMCISYMVCILYLYLASVCAQTAVGSGTVMWILYGLLTVIAVKAAYGENVTI